MADDRWLDRDGLAAYLKVRVDYLPRMQRSGKLPAPSLLLGPKSPRWDRNLIDRAFSGSVQSDVDEIVERLADDIRSGRHKNSHKNARGRHA